MTNRLLMNSESEKLMQMALDLPTISKITTMSVEPYPLP